MDEDIRKIRITHAYVFHADLDDAEKIKHFILDETEAHLIFERHTGNFIRVIEEKPTPYKINEGGRHG